MVFELTSLKKRYVFLLYHIFRMGDRVRQIKLNILGSTISKSPTSDYGTWLEIKSSRDHGCCNYVNNEVKLSDIATYDSGQNGYVLNTDTTILDTQYLTIPYGDILLMPPASPLFILTNRGKITIHGSLFSAGNIVNSGTMINNGTLTHASGGRFTNTGSFTNKNVFGIDAPLYNTGTITNVYPGTINNTSIIYNYAGGLIDTYSAGFTNLSGSTLNNPVTNTGCGIGTLVGVTATGTACPP